MRIDRILANSGMGSRLEVKQILKDGRISLHGVVLKNPAQHITEEETSHLLLDGEPIRTSEFLYYALHKPAGFITAMDDKKQQTVAELVPDFFPNKRIAPVGRLDKDTTGLLLFTNDGTLHHRLLSPKYNIERRYFIEISQNSPPFTEADAQEIAAGVDIGSGVKTNPAKMCIQDNYTCELILTEGKFHEVKRMMFALDKELTRLHRLSYGNIQLEDLPLSEYREISADELNQLRLLCDLQETNS